MDMPASLYVNYLLRRKADHERLTSALANGDALVDFRTIGHQIKGNAVSFGFNDLVAIGEQMENLSRLSLETHGEKLLQDFRVWIDATEKRLRFEFPKAEI